MSENEDDPAGGLADMLGGLLGGDGDGLGGLFAQAQQAMAASQAAAEQEVEGSAGGGVVRIRSTGGGEVLDVHISPEVVDRDDIQTLEDLVVAAFRDVHAKIGALHQQAIGGFDPSSMLGGLGEMGDVSGLFGTEGTVIETEGIDSDGELE